ncbi:hypothetical protein GCM10027051_03660 [Niabella terrae]
MKSGYIILFGLIWLFSGTRAGAAPVSFDFYGERISFEFDRDNFVDFKAQRPDADQVRTFYQAIRQRDYRNLFTALETYRRNHRPDDWLYYQLVRQTAQVLSPKEENYLRYTLYKWYFLVQSGYGVLLSHHGKKLLLYIQCDENIFNIPYRMQSDGRQFVCLNYHDYGSNINFEQEPFEVIPLALPGQQRGFSYKITRLPDFDPAAYRNRQLAFRYHTSEYQFNIRINPQINRLFNNYPVVAYADYLNIPLSNETYRSLIVMLKKQLKGMHQRAGVDYLMHFTRYAFPFETDSRYFGSEKRLSPEQTLLSPYSDCDDRVGLFFFLVKEIYRLPMIVLAYPGHVTIAVQFDKPVGTTIQYDGARYTVCEPTPQSRDLKIGELLPELKKELYTIAYVYRPEAVQ